MNKDQLITKQLLDIVELKEKLAFATECMRDIDVALYAVGAPLNDNVNGCTQDQLKPFFEINRVVRNFCDYMSGKKLNS